LAPAAAQAQALNYGSLEQIFGEPVTLSATGKPQTVSDVPASMIIITADQIRRSGAITVADLPSRLLKNYAGIDVQQASAQATNLSIAGYDGPFSSRLLVLVNGRQVYLDHYGYTEWATIPVELAAIRQIEVVKGPASALFGFNATDGVINIVTFDPLDDKINEVAVAGGQGAYAAGSAVVSARPADNVGVRLTAGGNREDEFAAWKDSGNPFKDAPFRRAISADGQMLLDDGSRLGLEATASTSDQTDINPFYLSTLTRYDTWSARGTFSTTTPVGVLSAQAYHNGVVITARQTGLVLDTGPDLGTANTTLRSDTSAAGFREGVTIIQVNDLYQINSQHTLREAIELRRNQMNSQATGYGTIGYDVFADSLMWDWQITPSISWTNAGRIDRLWLWRSGPLPSIDQGGNAQFNRAQTCYSYNSGLVDHLSDHDTARLTAGQAVQVPSLLQYGLIFATAAGDATTLFSGNSSLKPTIVRKYEAAYNRLMADNRITLDAAIYRQETTSINDFDVSELFVPPQPGGNGMGGYYLSTAGNVGNSSELGLELSARASLTKTLTIDANYTYADVSDHFANGFTTAKSLVTPRHKVNAHLGYSLTPVDLDLFAHYVSQLQQAPFGYTGFAPVTVPNYVELDATVSWHITDAVTARLIAADISPTHHREDSGPPVDRRIIGAAAVTF
jgi:iron complex outermembrane receptor protein